MNKTARILIVDDEPFNVDYLEQELEDQHYETISAVNGQDAIDKMQIEAPDLVLLDIMMPVMDGFSVLAKMKADTALRDIPVIVISATNDLENVVKGIKMGAEDYLPKPFEPALLQARIASCLEKKYLRDLQGLYLKGLEHELNIARDIQQEFLPAQLPELNGWELASYFKAAKEVAGDFYDAFLLPDGKLAFVIADVCGKGIGAALFMTLFRSLIHAAALTDQFFPTREQKIFTSAQRLQHVISLTNNYIADVHEASNMFATVFMGILDPANGTLAYINCGNEPPLIINQNGVRASLDRTGPAVGAIPQANFMVKEISIGNEDVLLAFTDGIPDCNNIKDDFFGRDRLLALLPGNQKSATALLDMIGNELNAFAGESEQFDDITMMAIKRTG
jgi:sigma-B regulation protein RsbU (phosphoserine phosphatase)